MLNRIFSVLAFASLITVGVQIVFWTTYFIATTSTSRFQSLALSFAGMALGSALCFVGTTSLLKHKTLFIERKAYKALAIALLLVAAWLVVTTVTMLATL